MKKYIAILPLFLLFITASCSEPEVTEEEKKEEPKKALIEREPEVREYFEVVNDLVDEYITITELFLDNTEKMQSGELGALETISLISEMGDAALKIQELNKEIEGLEEKKEKIEETLTAEDVQEFVTMYGETMKRAYELAKRIEEVGGVDLSALAAGGDTEETK